MNKEDKEEEYANQLKNYLFKGLKCQAMGCCVEGTEYDDNPIPIEYELVGIYKCPELGFRAVLKPPTGDNYECHLEDVLPIVRYLDLVSEIEHNGHRFRPLLRIVEKYLDNFEDVKFGGEVTVIYPFFKKLNEIHFTYLEYFGCVEYKDEIITIEMSSDILTPIVISVKPEMFLEAFYNWHFWIFDIPKSYILIDKLTGKQLENV
jgi:hypothetical protein